MCCIVVENRLNASDIIWYTSHEGKKYLFTDSVNSWNLKKSHIFYLNPMCIYSSWYAVNNLTTGTKRSIKIVMLLNENKVKFIHVIFKQWVVLFTV